MSLSKSFRITERQSILSRFDAINTFNTPIFAVNGYSTDVLPGDFTPARYTSDLNYQKSAPTGVVNTSLGARNLEFGLRIHF